MPGWPNCGPLQAGAHGAAPVALQVADELLPRKGLERDGEPVLATAAHLLLHRGHDGAHLGVLDVRAAARVVHEEIRERLTCV